MEKAYRLIKEFTKAKIDFLVIGGIAVVFYGVKRATFDIDILIPPNEKVIKKILSVLKKLNYKGVYKITQNGKELRRIGSISKINTKNILKHWAVRVKNGFDVDIMLAPGKEYFDFLNKYRVESTVNGAKIKAPNILDLIRLKESSSREKDKNDVKELRHILRTQKK